MLKISAAFCVRRELLQARADYAGGRISLEALRSTEDRAILEALEGQRKAGIPIFTDGELRRGSWLTDMADAVDGFVADKVILDWKGPGGGPEGSTAQAVGAKLRKIRKMTGARSAIPEKSRARALQGDAALAGKLHGVEL